MLLFISYNTFCLDSKIRDNRSQNAGDATQITLINMYN